MSPKYHFISHKQSLANLAQESWTESCGVEEKTAVIQGGSAAPGGSRGGHERREGTETGVNGKLHSTPFTSDSQVML